MGKKPVKDARSYLTIDASDDLKDRWKAAAALAAKDDPDLSFSRWCRRVLTKAAEIEESVRRRK